MGEERLPQRVMFEELAGCKGYSGGHEKDWMAHLKEGMSVFGTKFEGWRKAAQKAGRWFRRVEEGAELFMRNWLTRRDAELQSDAQRPRQRHPPSASLSGRGEGGGGDGGGGRGEGGKGGGGKGGEGCGAGEGGHRAQETGLGLVIIVLKVVGLPMVVT